MNKITKQTKPGAEFSGKPKPMEESRVFAFSGGKFNAPGWPAKNIHTSLDFAKSVGLPTRAVSATQYEGHLTDLLIDLFGKNWFKHGRMEAKFIALVDVNDVVTSRAVVVSNEKEGDTSRITLDTWCENQRGEKVLVGKSSCLVD
jgi:acyl dehydratase